jgi:PEP-CTERM motif-containing protein
VPRRTVIDHSCLSVRNVWNSVVDSVGASGSSAFVLLGTAGAPFISSFSRSGSVAFTQSGTLAPGDYFIIGQSDSIANAGPIFGHPILNEASNSFTIDLSVTPSAVVPEPATLILFGTGTAGLWWRRKRRI